MIEVPPLRQLRHLPVAVAQENRSKPTWSVRHGIIAASLILAALPALWALWSRWTEPRIPPFDPTSQLQFVDQRLDELTPAQAWQQWIEWFRPLGERGFSELAHPYQAQVEREVTKARFLQKTLLAVAGMFGVVALVAVFWPRAKPAGTRRHGDKETWR
jgi:hypothetical protein